MSSPDRLHQPLVISGPCVAESYELLEEVCDHMRGLADEFGFRYIFKASFDKANRTSNKSYRGPGLQKCMEWFADLKASRPGLEVLTDIHESTQVEDVAKVCDWLQIPAFLCRQTDLIVAAVETGKKVNIKKGQFLAPEGVDHIAAKVKGICDERGQPVRLALTERGTTFGYGNYVVDMRAFQAMARTGAHVIFDGTHSVQRPGEGGSSGQIAGGERHHIPALARAATATGYLDGYFFEVHPRPDEAKSDGSTVLSFPRIRMLLEQIVPLWRASLSYSTIDREFYDAQPLRPKDPVKVPQTNADRGLN